MSYVPTMSFAPASIDACGYWRMWIPYLNLPYSRFQFTQGMPPMDDLAEGDVLCVQRLMTAENMTFLKIAREHGIKIVYDLDDNLWQVPKFNPAYSKLCTPEAHRGLQACLEWADVLTCSTKELAKVAEENIGWIRNVVSGKHLSIVHIDNVVDTKIFTMPEYERDPDKVVLGWGGSNTHLGDIALVWNLLPDLIEKYSYLYLEFVGHDPPAKLIGHPRVRTREWCHISEFSKRYATWNWDIVLAPLDDHKFNRSKSSIKMQEAAAIGKPCLAQDIAPYRYFTSKMPELNWLLCHDYTWKKKLEELIENRPLRLQLGVAMRKNIEDNFNITRTIPQWEEACYSAYTA